MHKMAKMWGFGLEGFRKHFRKCWGVLMMALDRMLGQSAPSFLLRLMLRDQVPRHTQDAVAPDETSVSATLIARSRDHEIAKAHRGLCRWFYGPVTSAEMCILTRGLSLSL